MRARNRVLAAVRRAVRDHALWQPGDRVLLACSGGADSMAALHLLARLQPSLGHRLAIGHVDHGLWPGSGLAAAAVQEVCAQLGLPCVHRALHLTPGPDLEARARLARYAALAEMARELDCDSVVTAHHADDQAETLLQRAARGAGPQALAGIRRHRQDGVVRPLLDVPRAWLRAAFPEAAVAQDPSNADLRFTRNALRHQVLPVLERALPGACAGLARTAAHLAAEAGTLDAWLEVALAPRSRLEAGALLIDLTGVPADAGPVLRFAARRLHVEAPSARAAAQFHAFLQGSAMTCAVRGMQIEKRFGHVRFCTADVARHPAAD